MRAGGGADSCAAALRTQRTICNHLVYLVQRGKTYRARDFLTGPIIVGLYSINYVQGGLERLPRVHALATIFD